MLSHIGQRLRQIRRRFSRTALVARLLGVDVIPPDGRAHGLVILQVDGLSRQQFDIAAGKRRLPFLRRMTQRRHFRELSFYSGLPSTTPAVQAEVMYGIRCAVPAFEFLHRETGRLFRMYEHDCAKTFADSLCEDGQPLLKDGCSYSNIYSGGAAEARFCAETIDLQNLLKMAGPIKLLIMFTLYVPTMIRVLGLAIVEVAVGLFDVLRGVFDRHDSRRELQCVLSRVMVGTVLREWLCVMVKLAVHQGRPVVYANFLGYDEHAHRRGPDSYFAHWCLKGIDRAVRDIFLSANRSDAREYEIVVFSDHGQERTRIYRDEFGCSVAEAVKRTFAESSLAVRDVRQADPLEYRGQQRDQQMRHLMRLRRGRQRRPPLTPEQLAQDVVVCAMGPLGHIYAPVSISADDKRRVAQRLVDEQHVPLVVFRDDHDNVVAKNASGLWSLPDDAAFVFGSDHPFLNEVTGDLIELVHHDDCGDLIISGWSCDAPPLSFEIENGAHGSIGSQETRGFALVPDALHITPRQTRDGDLWIRGQDIHAAAQRFLHEGWVVAPQVTGESHGTSVVPARVEDPPSDVDSCVRGNDETSGSLRVMSYNIHSAVGVDGKISPERLARVIRHCRADIVALQEVDVNRARTGHRDQSAVIASVLAMNHLFFPVHEHRGEQYGLSILSRFPLDAVPTADAIKSRSAA